MPSILASVRHCVYSVASVWEHCIDLSAKEDTQSAVAHERNPCTAAVASYTSNILRTPASKRVASIWRCTQRVLLTTNLLAELLQ
jgi:hypothetical protein